MVIQRDWLLIQNWLVKNWVGSLNLLIYTPSFLMHGNGNQESILAIDLVSPPKTTHELFKLQRHSLSGKVAI